MNHPIHLQMHLLGTIVPCWREPCLHMLRPVKFPGHRGQTDDGPMMSHPKDVLKHFFVCYKNILEYIGLLNIEQGFHGEPGLNKCEKTPN